MTALLAFIALVLLTPARVGRAAKRGAQAIAGVTMRVVRRGRRAVRRIQLELLKYWYAAKPHIPQMRFLFGGLVHKGQKVWAKFRGLLGGRGLGKTIALMKKAHLLAMINRGKKGKIIYGAILGRTIKEAEDKLVPALLEIGARIERDLGIRFKPTYDAQTRILTWPWGSKAYVLSYEDTASLELIRGYNLGWAVIDEIEVAPVPIERLLAVVNFAIRDPDAPHKTFAWASSPKGYKGMPKLHAEARRRQDPDYYLVHGTIYDNPYLSPKDIETIKRTIPSRRLWLQEGLAICVMPRNIVFPEYNESVHLKKHAWIASDKTWISIDWGLAKAYVCAFKVNARGEWFLVKERKVVQTTRRRFREVVDSFVLECIALDLGADPFGFSCDRAVRSERQWLFKKFGKRCGFRDPFGNWVARVLWLSPDAEMRVEWGCSVLSSLLEPDDYEAPKFYVSDALTDASDLTMGIRGAFRTYGYEVGRDKQTGEELVSDEPSKKSGADDPIDTARYAIVATRNIGELHGGKPLPYIPGDTSEPEVVDKKPAPKKPSRRAWLAANDDGFAAAAA